MYGAFSVFMLHAHLFSFVFVRISSVQSQHKGTGHQQGKVIQTTRSLFVISKTTDQTRDTHSLCRIALALIEQEHRKQVARIKTGEVVSNAIKQKQTEQS